MLEGLKKPRGDYHTCKVELLKRTLEPKDITALDGYLSDPHFGPILLSNALAERGVDLPSKSIQKHKAKTCSCFRS